MYGLTSPFKVFNRWYPPVTDPGSIAPHPDHSPAPETRLPRIASSFLVDATNGMVHVVNFALKTSKPGGEIILPQFSCP